MKTRTFGLFVLVALGVAVASPAALALCPVDVTFGQVGSAGNCGGSCYVKSSGQNTMLSLNKSFFWRVGGGDPTIGPGDDNGKYQANGTGGNKPWIIGDAAGNPYPGGFQMNSGWNQGETDGCANATSQTMAGAFFDTNSLSTEAFYAVSTANLNLATSGAQWDFGAGNAHIVLQPIPALQITNSTRNLDNSINLTVQWTNNSSAAFTPNLASGATPSTVITGYTIHSREIARVATLPNDRNRAAWSAPLVTVAGAGASTGSLTVVCGNVTDNNVYLSLGINFDSGFTSPFVGAASTRIECNPNLANPAGKFKVVDKPGRKVGLEK